MVPFARGPRGCPLRSVVAAASSLPADVVGADWTVQIALNDVALCEWMVSFAHCLRGSVGPLEAPRGTRSPAEVASGHWSVSISAAELAKKRLYGRADSAGDVANVEP